LGNYRELFKAHIETEWLKKIRDNINKGLALGNKRFTIQYRGIASNGKESRMTKDNINNNQLMLL